MADTSPRRNSAGLARDVAILDLLAAPEALAAGGLGVTRIAELLGRDKAAVSRALATLADAAILERDPAQRTYRLGSRLYALAARTDEAHLKGQAENMLRSMVHTVRETTHLCVLRAGRVLTLSSEPSPYMVGTASWTGSFAPAWRTPSGRALLSDWPQEQVEQWYSVHGPARPDADLPALLTELAAIDLRGYALSDEELEPGVVAASAPVLGPSRTILAALNVSAPKSRWGDRLDELGRFVAQHAGRLSTRIGAADAAR